MSAIILSSKTRCASAIGSPSNAAFHFGMGWWWRMMYSSAPTQFLPTTNARAAGNIPITFRPFCLRKDVRSEPTQQSYLESQSVAGQWSEPVRWSRMMSRILRWSSERPRDWSAGFASVVKNLPFKLRTNYVVSVAGITNNWARIPSENARPLRNSLCRPNHPIEPTFHRPLTR